MPETRAPITPLSPDVQPVAPGANGSSAADGYRWAAKAVAADFRTVEPVPERRLVVIPDCENETDCVESSLRFAGLLGKKGRFRAKFRGAHIVQTGDLIHKNAPDPAVVPFWEGLRGAAEEAGSALHMVAGNHELEIWRRLRSGARLGLKRCDQEAVERLIRTMKLFHTEGSMLFIHGYPTVELLRHMLGYLNETGQDLNEYNRDCFRPALEDPKRLARYAYQRRAVCRNCLLYDVPNPENYYRRHGREIAGLLGSLGIDLVVHGHRPERSGVQADHELQQWLPGIRMIGNDIQLRLQGLGATVIRQAEKGSTEVLFVNRKSSTSAHCADVRRILRARKHPFDVWPEPKKAVLDGVVFRFLRDRESRPLVLAAATAATDA